MRQPKKSRITWLKQLQKYSQSLHISRSCSDDVRHHHAILKIHTSLCIGERKAVTRVGFLLSAISGFDTCRAHFLSVCCPFKSDDVLEFRPPSDFLACLERLRTSQISLVLSTNTLSLSLSSLSISCSVPTEFRGVEGGSDDVGVGGSSGVISDASRSIYSWNEYRFRWNMQQCCNVWDKRTKEKVDASLFGC